MTELTSICVYCGSSAGTDPAIRLAAERLGQAMGESGLRLVYGGGETGLVAALARHLRALPVMPVIGNGRIALDPVHLSDLCDVIQACLTRDDVLGQTYDVLGPDRVTLDLGNKSVAADPLLEKRVTLLDFPEYKTVGHNEEHLIVETAGAARYKPGDVVYALPGHICPTVALHKEALVAEDGKIVGRWTVASRDRVLSV